MLRSTPLPRGGPDNPVARVTQPEVAVTEAVRRSQGHGRPHRSLPHHVQLHVRLPLEPPGRRRGPVGFHRTLTRVRRAPRLGLSSLYKDVFSSKAARSSRPASAIGRYSLYCAWQSGRSHLAFITDSSELYSIRAVVDPSEAGGVLPGRQSAWLSRKNDLNADPCRDRTSAASAMSRPGIPSFTAFPGARD